MDYERILNICQVIEASIEDLAMIDNVLEQGSYIEMRLYDRDNTETRRVPVTGEVIQDELLGVLQQNRKEALLISLDELNSLIKEVSTV